MTRLFVLQAERLADFQDDRARDARQHAARRRHGANVVVVNPKQIAAGGLGHFAVRVEQQRLVRAPFHGLGARHDVQNFARRLERGQRIGGGDPKRGGDQIPLQRSAGHRLGVTGTFSQRAGRCRRSRCRMQRHHDRRVAVARSACSRVRPARASASGAEWRRAFCFAR